MVSAMSPMLGYESRLQAALEKQRRAATKEHQLPTYSEATKGQSPIEVSEKELPSAAQKSGKLAALKRMLRPVEPDRSTSVDSSSSSSSECPSLKSILTGEVYQHDPSRRMNLASMGGAKRHQL